MGKRHPEAWYAMEAQPKAGELAMMDSSVLSKHSVTVSIVLLAEY